MTYDTTNPIESLTIRQLRALSVLDEERHFGRAAARLEISQPSLSQLVGRIEGVLGADLFVRRPRVTPTGAGDLFLPRVHEALARLAGGARDVDDLMEGRSGRLAIRFASSALVSPFPAVLRAFRQLHPGIRIDLLKGSSATILESLEGDEVGVVRRGPRGIPPGAVVLTDEPFVLALPHDDPLLDADVVDLARLRNQPFVHFPRRESPDLHDEIARVCSNAGFEIAVALEATEWLTILGLVGAGLGVALVPASFRTLRWGEVAYRPLGEGAPRSAVIASHRPDAASAALGLFMTTARDSIRRSQRAATTRVV